MHKTTRSEPLAPAVGSQFERSVRPRAWLVEDPDPNGPRTFIATQDMEDAYSLATDEAPPIPLYDQAALDSARQAIYEAEAAQLTAPLYARIETLLRGINDARCLMDPIWRERMGAEQVREHVQRGMRCIASAITDCQFTGPNARLTGPKRPLQEYANGTD